MARGIHSKKEKRRRARRREKERCNINCGVIPEIVITMTLLAAFGLMWAADVLPTVSPLLCIPLACVSWCVDYEYIIYFGCMF